MKVYLALLECNYPAVSELTMADFYLGTHLSFDPTAPKRVYQMLKKYHGLHEELDRAEKIAEASLNSFGRKPSGFLERLERGIYYIKHRPFTLRFSHHGLHYMDTPGFTREIAPHLVELYDLEYKIYDEFPDQYVKVNWDKLQAIEPDEVKSIIHLQNWHVEERDENCGEAEDRINEYKGQAERAIQQILEIINKYKIKWLLPRN